MYGVCCATNGKYTRIFVTNDNNKAKAQEVLALPKFRNLFLS
jgi:hypothetical protein